MLGRKRVKHALLHGKPLADHPMTDAALHTLPHPLLSRPAAADAGRLD